MSSAPYFWFNSFRGASFRRHQFFLAWLPILLFLGIITLESTPAFGSNHTSAPLHRIFSLVLGSTLDSHWTFIHHILRKCGHFAGFGILSLLCYRGFRLTLRTAATHLHGLTASLAASHALAIAVAFLVACADEFHQSFLPNRTGCVADVLLDTAGAAAAQLALYLIVNCIDQISTSRLSKSALHPHSPKSPGGRRTSLAELSA